MWAESGPKGFDVLLAWVQQDMAEQGTAEQSKGVEGI